MTIRHTMLLEELAAAAASQDIPFPVPAWATSATIFLKATADGTGAGTLKVQQGDPEGEIYEDIPGAVTDTLTTTDTSVRAIMIGAGAPADPGTPYTSAPGFPLSQHMKLVLAETAGALTDVKVWAEFRG